MKLGVIVVFHNNALDIDNTFFIEYLKNLQNVVFCFVNNASKDHTFQVLKSIVDHYPELLCLVDIKKQMPELSAIKAGVRLLKSIHELEFIGLININHLKNPKELDWNIKTVVNNKNTLIDILKNSTTKYDKKYMLLTDTFYIHDMAHNIKSLQTH